MKNYSKTREQLLKELEKSKFKIAELEKYKDRRKKIEEMLRSSEREKEIILDSLMEHVIYEDKKMKILWANKAACESAGLAREELVGRYCYEIGPRRNEPCTDCPVLKAMETKKPQETEKVTPDGRVWFIQGYPTQNEEGDIVGGIEVTFDITERIQTEKALYESEAKIKSFFDTAPLGIGLIKDRKLGWTNDRMYEMIGFPNGSLFGKSSRVLYENDKEYERAGRILYRSMKEKEIGEVETRWKRKDGSVFNCFIRVTPLNTSDPFAGNIAIILDHTEQKKAEENLLKSEERFKKLSNLTFEGIWIQDKGVTIDVNESLEGIIGYTREEVIGVNLIELCMLREYHATIKENIIKKRTKPYEVMARKKDGTLFPVELEARGIKGGDKEFWVTAIRDITERKRALEKLHKSEDRLSKVMIAVNDGMWDWNLRTNEVYFDPRYYTISGYNADEFPHQFEEFQKRVHPGDIENVMTNAEKHLKGEMERFDVEFRFARSDGSWMWILGRGIIVERDDDGNPTRFIGTHTDISKRKHVEAELAEHREHLQELIKERTAELEEKNIKLTQFNKLFVDREFRIKDLKDKVKELEGKKLENGE